MKSVLVVEDSAVVTKVIKHVLSQSPLLKTDFASSFDEARRRAAEKPYFAAIVDLNLPDAPNGEVVDFTREKNIPTIVLTSTFDEQRRELMLKKGIVDYVTKEGRYSYELARHTIERLIKNTSIKVLVVDDSSAQRKLLSHMLKLQLFQVLEAENGVEAIKVILQNPDLKLVITDFNMPKMDGFELIKNVRVKYQKSDLIIVGISSEGEGALSAKFIKYGANDFLNKPFNQEEFFCRVNHNIEFIELIEQVRDTAKRDELTGVYNKTYFLKRGQEVYDKAKSSGSVLSLALIEFDEMGELIARYGEDTGAQVLARVAKHLQSAFSRFVLTRGDDFEFLVLMPGLNADKAAEYVERVRQLVMDDAIDLASGANVQLGFSAGVSAQLGENLCDLVAGAEACLQRSIDAGGGLVVGD